MTKPIRLTLTPLGLTPIPLALTEPSAWEFELRRGEEWIGSGTAPSLGAAIDAAERMRAEDGFVRRNMADSDSGIIETSDGRIGFFPTIPVESVRRLLVVNIDGTIAEARCDGCKHWHTGDSWIHRQRAPRGECYGMTTHREERGYAVEGEVFDTWTMPGWGCSEFEPKEPA